MDRRDLRRACTFVVTSALLLGCTAGPTGPTSGGGPLTTRSQGSQGTGIDGVQPGSPFVWADILVYNDATEAAVIDAYEVVGASAGLTVVAAGVEPFAIAAPRGCASLASVPSSCSDEVGARPLVGTPIQPATTAGWTKGAFLVFILTVAHPAEYGGAAIALTYHVGSARYSSTIRASVDVCAGADAPGGVCPLPSAPSGL